MKTSLDVFLTALGYTLSKYNIQMVREAQRMTELTEGIARNPHSSLFLVFVELVKCLFFTKEKRSLHQV
jgi:hypothetical protein